MPLPPQTSETHPIRVSWVARAGESGGGQLGLCFCPGKRLLKSRLRRAGHRDESGQPIARDLRADLARLRNNFGATCIVCLLSAAELRSIGVAGDYGGAVASAGMAFLSFPIIEGAASAAGGAVTNIGQTAEQLVHPVVARLRAGEGVVMHCRGGVGRAGMLAACVLLELGACRGAARAIELVRARRCKAAVETRRQEDFVKAYWQLLGGNGGADGGGSSGGSSAAAAAGAAADDTADGWCVSHEQLAEFYSRHDVSKVARVGAILARFRPAEIRAKLLQKYGEACGGKAD